MPIDSGETPTGTMGDPLVAGVNIPGAVEIIPRDLKTDAQCAPFTKVGSENRIVLAPLCDEAVLTDPTFRATVVVEVSVDGTRWRPWASCTWAGQTHPLRPGRTKRRARLGCPAPAEGMQVRVRLSCPKEQDIGLELAAYGKTRVVVPKTNSVGVIGTPDSTFADGASSASFSLDVGSGSDSAVVVGVSTYPTRTVSTCTYNGTAVGAIGSATDADGTIVYLRGLKAPTSGSNTLAVTMSGTGDLSLGGIGLENVDQTTAFGTPGTDTSGGASNSVTLTDGDTGDLHIAATTCWADSSNGPGNPVPGNTARVEEYTEGADACLDMSSAVGSTSTAMSYTYPGSMGVSSASAMIAVTVFESAGGATDYEGTGALAAQAAAVSGAGLHHRVSTAALLAQAAALSGSGLHGRVSPGVLTVQAAAVGGTGTRGRAGTGALTGQNVTITGEGTRGRAGTGTLTAGVVVLSAEGTRNRMASGALQVQDATISGAGEQSGGEEPAQSTRRIDWRRFIN